MSEYASQQHLHAPKTPRHPTIWNLTGDMVTYIQAKTENGIEKDDYFVLKTHGHWIEDDPKSEARVARMNLGYFGEETLVEVASRSVEIPTLDTQYHGYQQFQFLHQEKVQNGDWLLVSKKVAKCLQRNSRLGQQVAGLVVATISDDPRDLVLNTYGSLVGTRAFVTHAITSR